MSARRRKRRAHALVAAIGVCAVAVTVAGCTLDRQATADALIKDVEKTDSIKLDAGQKACLQQLIAGLSADEIDALNTAKASAALQSKFLVAKAKCMVPSSSVPGGSTPRSPTGTGLPGASTTPSATVASTPPSGSVRGGTTTVVTGPPTTFDLGVFTPRTVPLDELSTTTPLGTATSSP